MATLLKRRYPIGAEVTARGVHFRVWAPGQRRVEVVLDPEGAATVLALEAEAGGYFSGLSRGARAGSCYAFRLNGDAHPLPDPASRFQPRGPNGPSEIVDPRAYAWRDQGWSGPDTERQVIYEMHVGTFTEEGSWAAATPHLPDLARLGITTVEILPIADFTGRFGWGYDGVDLFAPTRLYGRPDEFRAFVDSAHQAGLAVLLDVVYNHFGPDGSYLHRFSPWYYHPECTTDWGRAVNFDGPHSAPVREFFTANATHWIDEYHLDGLRLDATQNMYDRSPEHIVTAIVRAARGAAKGRRIYVVAENEPQHTELLDPPASGGSDIDALWNDDFHHSATVALTGRAEAYYSCHGGAPQEFISVAKHAFLYQGQYYPWQKQRRGTLTTGIAPFRFVNYLDNHDQVANSGRGYRCHMLTSPGRYRAMTALLLLLPGTPLLFQGQEYAASTPFFYFADHREEIAESVKVGRAAFLAQFRSLASTRMQGVLPDPANPDTFVRSKLDHAERHRHRETWELHRSLLALRRTDPVFACRRPGRLDGAVLGPEAFVLRFGCDDPETRLLLVNLGVDLLLEPAPEPLLAPPRGAEWSILWSSEDPTFGGRGVAALGTCESWWLSGHAAAVLQPRPAAPEPDQRENC